VIDPTINYGEKLRHVEKNSEMWKVQVEKETLYKVTRW
jgi:hypothetical protein